MRHALVHFGKFAGKFARCPVKHHQYRRRSECPAAALVDTDGGTGHLTAGAAVQAAHRADVIIAEKTLDEVAFSQQIAAFLRGQLRMFRDRGHQQAFHLHHLWDLPPVEHAAHQHQDRQRMRFQYGFRAFADAVDHLLRVQRGEQNTGIFLDNAQQRAIIPALSVSGHRVEILSVVLVPESETFPVVLLLRRRKRQERTLRARFHHMVKAVGHAVRQAFYKRILCGQHGKQLLSLFILRHIVCHLHGKFVRKSHDRQEFPLFFRKRVDHGSGKHRINIGIPIRQRPTLGKRPQVQIDCRKPALTGIKQRIDLFVRKFRSAPMCVNSQFSMVQPKLLSPDLIDLAAQTDRLCGRQEPIAAGYKQMHIAGQAVCQFAEKAGSPAVCQQMKVIDENIAGGFSFQLMADRIDQQSAAGGIARTDIIAQKVKPCSQKSILHAFPEDREIIGIHADTDDPQKLCFRAFLQVPVHGRCFAVAHRRHHSR